VSCVDVDVDVVDSAVAGVAVVDVSLLLLFFLLLCGSLAFRSIHSALCP
jgi:hypothetical protein